MKNNIKERIGKKKERKEKRRERRERREREIEERIRLGLTGRKQQTDLPEAGERQRER